MRLHGLAVAGIVPPLEERDPCMGKGQRNRAKHTHAPPRREMLANTPDSLNDIPDGGLSAFARDEIDPQCQAWGLLQSYSVGLLMELAEQDPPEPGPEASDTEREAHRLRTQAKPFMLASAPDGAAEFVAMMKPRWRGVVTRAIFAEVTSWLEESGSEPDERDLFAGARKFARFMVPRHHRDEVSWLLDRTVLAERAAEINAPFPAADRIREFRFRDPDHTIWFAVAMREVHPVVMVHAAAALATWVHSCEGSVVDVNQKRIELGRRSIDYGTLLDSAPPREEHAPDEAEPEWTAPWEFTATVPTAENTPMDRPVPIAYHGPPLSPWHAAWLWAEAIRTSDDRNRDCGDRECALITRAITALAQADGSVDVTMPTVNSPEVYADCAVVKVFLLCRDEETLLRTLTSGQGALPREGDPGCDAHRAMTDVLKPTSNDAVGNPELVEQVDRALEGWLEVVQRARTMAFGAYLAQATERTSTVPLSHLGGMLNTYLQQHEAR